MHEAYLRLVGPEEGRRWANRAHFFAAAAEAMRRILVEEARRKQSLKRGGALGRHDLDDSRLAAPDGVDILELDEALDRLAARDPESAQLRGARFGGDDDLGGRQGPGPLRAVRRTAAGPTPARSCGPRWAPAASEGSFRIIPPARP